MSPRLGGTKVPSSGSTRDTGINLATPCELCDYMSSAQGSKKPFCRKMSGIPYTSPPTLHDKLD